MINNRIGVIKVFRCHTLITIITLFTSATFCFSQSGTIAFGLEYKPIFPVNFLHTGTQSTTDLGIQYNIALSSGFNVGGVIRKNFTKLLSFEAGINYVKRNYDINIIDGSHNLSSPFQIIGYEIPVSLLIYAQMGEKIYMNASMGISPDMFASNVQTTDDNYKTFTNRNHIIQPAILANVGVEWRTEEAGSFYLGASYHGPFNSDFISSIYYLQNAAVYIPLSGSYLTIDFRYFFPAETKNIKKTSDSD